MKKSEIESIINKYQTVKEQNRASYRRIKKRVLEEKNKHYIDNRPKYWKKIKEDKNWVELEFCPNECKSKKGELKKFFKTKQSAENNSLPNQTVYLCNNQENILGYHITTNLKLKNQNSRNYSLLMIISLNNFVEKITIKKLRILFHHIYLIKGEICLIQMQKNLKQFFKR